MEYGIIEGFAEKLDGINRVGNGAKIQSVKLNERMERLNNISGEGSIIEHFIEGTKGKYFYINTQDIRSKLPIEHQNDVGEYILFALITEDGEHIYDVNNIKSARHLFSKILKQVDVAKKIGLLFLIGFVFLILLAPPIALLIFVPFLFFILILSIPAIIKVKRGLKGPLNATKIQYERMEPSKLEKFLLKNGFSFS